MIPDVFFLEEFRGAAPLLQALRGRKRAAVLLSE